MHLRNVQYTDPFEGTQEEKDCLEHIPGLPNDPDDYHEDTNIIVDYYKQTFEVGSNDFAMGATSEGMGPIICIKVLS